MLSYPSGPNTPRSHLPFSPAVRHGDLLFISGQASVDGEGKIVSDTFEGEMRRSIENLARILADCGSSLALVAQTRNYVRDPEDLATFNRVYREYFSAPYPARTTIQAARLPKDCKVEIDAIAAL